MFDVIVHSALALLLALPPTVALLGTSGATSTPATTAEELTVSEPTIKDSSRGQTEHPDGRLSRWVSVTYELSTGQEAQAFVEVDSFGIGEATIDLEGEPLLHVTVDQQGITNTWTAPGVNVSPDMFGELLGAVAATEVFAGIMPQAAGFPCSEYGEKVLKAGKYIWGGMVAAAGVMCCGAFTGGCPGCAAAAWVVGEAGVEALEDYCA